jgi:hypothetical protein
VQTRPNADKPAVVEVDDESSDEFDMDWNKTGRLWVATAAAAVVGVFELDSSKEWYRLNVMLSFTGVLLLPLILLIFLSQVGVSVSIIILRVYKCIVQEQMSHWINYKFSKIWIIFILFFIVN